MSEKLPIWVVYDNPTDLPGSFVARKWLLDQPTTEIHQAKTLEDVRGKLPKGLIRLPRNPNDDPKIVELWV